MRRLPAFIVAVAALIATAPALAQTRQNEITAAPPNFPIQRQCINQAGQAVPCSFSDIPAPDVAPPFMTPGPDKRSLVVTVSPNSGALAPFPPGAIPTTAIGAGSTGAVTATMAALLGQINYVCSVHISALGGTATVGPITVAGLAGGNTLTYQVASLAAGNFLIVPFQPCFPASASNTAITVTTTADGTASAVDVNVIGYRNVR